MKNKKSPSSCGLRQEQRESSGTPPVSLRDAKRQRSAQRLYGRSSLLKKNGLEIPKPFLISPKLRLGTTNIAISYKLKAASHKL
ncbi:MAG: hypothetical protein KBS54_02940 [Synergistaceae bacterium]|nr:hypothetical protein [Candidatus Equadaptatus faecalis]